MKEDFSISVYFSMFKSRRIPSSDISVLFSPNSTLDRIEKTTDNLKRKLVLSQIIKKLLIFLVISVVLLWLGLGLKKIVTPPELIVINPPDNFVAKNTLLKINGLTEKEAEVFINNQPVSYNKEGYFEETISLKPGLNKIRISVNRGDGRERVVWRRVMVAD
jgi:hypothetical protein